MKNAREMFEGKKVTLLGLGLHGGGVGTAQCLSEWGAKVTVTDIKTADQLTPSLRKLKGYKNITLVLGQHREEDFTRADRVVISPAVSWSSPYVRLAIARGVPVDMDASIFFSLCDVPIIGITGTKGKTTTSTFIHAILREAGIDAHLVGVGQLPVLPYLKNLKKKSVVVFELSSWRLSALGRMRISPGIGVFRNFFPDHLNYYKTLEEYFDDKRVIYAYQKPTDTVVLNVGNEEIRNHLKEVPSRVLAFSWKDEGFDPGIFRRGEEVFLRQDGEETRIVSLKEVRLRGKHVFESLLAGLGASYAYGLSPRQLQKGALACKGVPHRLEFVREVGGVRYYNDTTATIPEASLSGIESFTQPVILIAGGSEKNLSYQEFAEQAVSRVKRVVLLRGEASDRMRRAFANVLGTAYREEDFPSADSMKQAVHIAKSFAEKGDVVLLSPGASSFGMFQNEFDRGEQFRAEVKKL